MQLPSLEALTAELTELQQKMSDPVVVKDARQMRQLARQYNDKKELLAVRQAQEQVTKEKADVQALLDNADEEMRRLAHEDAERLLTQEHELNEKLRELLIPKDARDSRDCILEIRAGAGGEEAALFASELFRAYTRYAEQQGWQMHVISQSFSEQSGYKEVIAEVSGQNVFGQLKYERGVQRVQRVPATEKQGRIHTSTVSVAVLPQAEEVDLVIRPEDLRIDTYRSSGAGGQHVNKTSSAVRITHLPTNTVVAVQDERSQHKNREKAMSILRARILAAQEEARIQETAQDRRNQIGTADRSEKIRTYNFPQDRITDHRIKESWSNIPGVLEGDLKPLISAMQTAERTLHLSNQL